MPKAPDWNEYYRRERFLLRFTQPFIFGALLRALKIYSVPHPVVVELGGAGGGVFDAVRRTLHPAAYHVVDTNEYGLNLIREKTGGGSVFLHLQDARNPALDLSADVVFSTGLIEHFDEEGTRKAIRSHLTLLKPGGVAVITFPTPTFLYRISRGISEFAGKRIFHDERPLQMPEIRAAIEGAGILLDERLIWQTPWTQEIVVIRKPSSSETSILPPASASSPIASSLDMENPSPRRLVVVLQACNPDGEMAAMVRELAGAGFAGIVVVDDGSAPGCEPEFGEVARIAGVLVCGHAVALGRVASWQTGMHRALYSFPEIAGVVTAAVGDRPADIMQIARTAARCPNAMILGGHAAAPGMAHPASRRLLQLFAGVSVSNVSSPLRAIPAPFARKLLERDVPSNEFDLDAVLAAGRESVAIVEEAIEGESTKTKKVPVANPLASLRAWMALLRFGSSRAVPALLWLLLLAPLAAEYFGFRSTPLLRQERWVPTGEVHFLNYTEAFAVFAFVGFFARRWFLPAAILGMLGLTIAAVGIGPPAAVLLFVFSATVLGRLVLGDAIEGPLAFLAGTALWIAAMYLTATLPIHYRATYFAALALPIAIGPRLTRRLALEWFDLFRPTRLAAPAEMPAFAGLAFVVAACWLVVLKPEISTDGLAMHLNIPASMALHHAYTIDFRRFVWAVMPMGADFCYAVVYMLGGEFAARLLNLAMLITIAALVFRGARAFVSRPVALMLTMICISTPTVYLVTGSMFVENFVAAMVLGGLIALWRFHETHAQGYLMLTAILLGTSIALKLGAAAAGLIGLGYLIWEVWRSRRPAHAPDIEVRPVARGTAFAAIVVVLLLGSIPYAKAWRLTGNPLFPYETAMFKSPLINGRDIQDNRFNQPLNWRTPFRLTFHTDLYQEGQAGSMGFQYLLFLPLTLAGFFALRSFEGRSAIVIGVVSALIIAGTKPNARYFYSALPPLTLGAAAALSWVRSRQPLVYRAALAAGLAAAFCNIWFLPCADWYNRDFYSAPLFSAAGRATYLHNTEGAVREVIAWINRNNRTKPVVFTDGSYTAGLMAPVYANNWHDYSFTMQVQATPLPAGVYRLFSRDGIAEMVVDQRHTDRQDAVTRLISACGVAEFAAGPFIAMKLRPDCEGVLRQTTTNGAICIPGEPLRRGNYDETDPRIVFAGKWTASRQYGAAYGQSITFSDAPGATACFAMEGTGFDYIHAMAYNRGRAEILVDGEPEAKFDLYSPGVEWQSRSSVRGLRPGRHVIGIRALPEKSDGATDFCIDVDRIIVY
jgi:SAM-dependent methyltransferase